MPGRPPECPGGWRPPDIEPIDIGPLPPIRPAFDRLGWLLAGAILGLGLGLLIGSARAETVDGSRIVIIDGDTVALPCAQPGPHCAERLRFYAIDAPETYRPRCEAERALGLRAKERLAQLLRGRPVEVRRGEPGTGRLLDPFRRTLGTLVTAEGDAPARLLAEGLALPWHPGRSAHDARAHTWCGRL